jgi:hypothetical protein
MEAIKQFEALIASKISVIKTLYSIICLEARLAGLSLLPLLVTAIILFVVLITAWMIAVFLMGYGIFLVSHHFILSISLVLLIHLVVVLSLVKYLAFNLKSMSFEKTRNYFSDHKSTEYEQLQETAETTNCTDGQKIAMREK